MNHPLVIGYKGEIGSYLLQGLLKFMPKASNIWALDINNDDNEMRVRLHISDVIFLCVPFNKTEEWLKKHAPFLRNKIVVEQTSLKSWVPECKRFLKEPYNCTLVSMHIMFRPSATFDSKDKKIAIIGKKQTQETTLIKNFITEVLSCKLIYFDTVEQHDSAMACQQALVHRVLLCLDSAMRTEAPSTYISMKVRELTNRICKGDLELYEAIQQNPKLRSQISNFNKKMIGFKISKYFNPAPELNKTKVK